MPLEAVEGPRGINSVIARTVAEEFGVVSNLSEAALQVHSQAWDHPSQPRRVFIDHGSFADASFWAYVAPRLLTTDVIVVGSSACLRVAERMIASHGPGVLCVPFGVDTGFFAPSADRKAVRQRIGRSIGLPEDGPYLLVVGTFSRRKNHHLALRFFIELLSRVPSARLVVAGGVPQRLSNLQYFDSVQSLARYEGIADRVHLLGSVPRVQVKELMQAASLLLHLSTCRIENFGLAVAEALACGLPVIAADWGGFRDLIRSGENGLLLRTWLSARGPRVDWLGGIRAAERLLHDPQMHAEWSHHARSVSSEWLSLRAFRTRVATAFEAVLREALKEVRTLQLTPAAQDLMFRTIHLNATRSEIGGTSDEYRMLIPLDGGRHYRLLSGPVATQEWAPQVRLVDRLYPVVTWDLEGQGARVTDPAWPDTLVLETAGADILRRCDGRAPLGNVLESVEGGPPRGALLALAQSLVHEGLLAPISEPDLSQ